jgi:hypothetical protein
MMTFLEGNVRRWSQVNQLHFKYFYKKVLANQAGLSIFVVGGRGPPVAVSSKTQKFIQWF